MFAFDIHGREPSVERLVVHMENMNRVIYDESADLEDIVSDPRRYRTTLTEWFAANRRHISARELTYSEFPSMWTWDASAKSWKKRKRSSKFGPPVGRIYHVHPTTGELYFLRLLLTKVWGARSYEDLKVHNGRLYDTYKEACLARGLVGDDNEWFMLFDEAIGWATLYQLRHLFMTVMLFCGVIDGKKLLEKYWRYMADDISLRVGRSLGDSRDVIPSDYLYVQLIQELTLLFGRNDHSFSSFNLTTVPIPSGRLLGNRLVLEEMQHDRNSLQQQSIYLKGRLNENQHSIYEEIMRSTTSSYGKVYFVSGHGGTGKTFLWNAIITSLRAEGLIVLAVASSGVAALLLPCGRTGHSRFRIPIEIDESSICNISRGTNLVELIQKASLVLWDEAPMTNR